MRTGGVRSALESFGGLLVIFKVHVINKAQIVVEPPVLGVILNTVLHQLDRALGLSRTVGRFGCQETAAKFIGDHEMRIQLSRDFEKGRQQIVTSGAESMPVAEVLHGARPINAGQQTVVTETGTLNYLRRVKEQDFVECGLWTDLVGTAKHDAGGCQ